MKRHVFFAVMIIFVLFFVACTSYSPNVIETPIETPVVTETPRVAETPVAVGMPSVPETPVATATPPPFTEGLTEGKLYFNEPEVVSSILAQPIFSGVFSHVLTEGQVREAFPYLDEPFSVQMHYKESDTLVEVFARRSPLADGPPFRFDIRFWRNGFGGDTEILVFPFPYHFTPKVSNIYGAPVVAYMIELPDHELMIELYGYALMHFRAEFEMDGFVFRVMFDDYLESGQERMTEIVNGIIRTGIEVFADLRRDGE